MLNLLFSFFIINGISGKIQGVVTNEDTKEPIPYADVIVIGTEMGSATDEQGNFYILNVRPGSYTVEVSCIGYQTKRVRNVVVEIDHTTRLKIALAQTAIEIAPVTVTSEMPVVKKDMVGTTYIVRKQELAALPIDYTMDLVTFQPAVARMDTALHVRGGRATEVLYMIDNVPIIDPQTGDPAINISKGIVDEIIFLPGGFDAEYGRAMSGVINLISSYPAGQVQLKTYGKTERIMPFYYDFGYENYQGSAHLPISRRFKGFISLDIMHTDDWNPKLYILPHKQRDDYSLYGKWLFAPSGKLKFTISGAQSRTQFDRYNTLWKFYLDHYRSDMREGNLQVLNVNYLPNSRYLLNATLSRLYTEKTFGVREEGDYGFFENYVFRDYTTLQWPYSGVRNPFGMSYWQIKCAGDYPQYQNKTSLVMKTNITNIVQIHKCHELKAGFEYTKQSFENSTYFISDSLHQILDDYEHNPAEYAFYLQDNIDYEGLYAKIGCRYDRFFWDIENANPITTISPRIGFSFLVTERFLFRTNVGRYVQPPLYDYIYSYYQLLPLPSYISDVPPIGNPQLVPEKTRSVEIGLQGEISTNLNATVNTFYKDVTDLIGTRLDSIGSRPYISYFNVENANVKGVEAILNFRTQLFTGKVSYTLSWAKGTSSYALEVYERSLIDPEFAPPAREYYLDFDQRHRFFVQGMAQLPFQTYLYLFGYFGDGFPYTPPGPEGKYEERNIIRLPFQRQIDCVIAKSFKIGGLSLNVDFEIMNLLDVRYEIANHFPLIPLSTINKEDFESDTLVYVDLHNRYYTPSADNNHDGLLTPFEEYINFRGLIEATDDWVNAYTAPRRARIGITMRFQ